MRDRDRIKYYTKSEERLNVISHAIGLFLSVIGLILLIVKAGQLSLMALKVSYWIFGSSIILLYAASTLYHSVRERKLRYRLNILDHASIYILIAGTYTPFSLVTLQGSVGWIIFGVVWALAIIGVILKLFFTGRFETLSTIMYVAMGWIIVFAVKPLIDNLSQDGLIWLFTGGISYTIGAVIFSIDRLKYNHAIFHVFVLFGTFCHFLAIYYYVIPNE
ncbi:PAQR family membrane homeostasis protein TrhA [Zunongwangia profunda]|uniref:Hemolysin-3 family protein n=2 Tax=Zunongwangia profunda TaxID=398743 RepID=D5BGL9_ZUNPS|nr:hemolysin III family protein [Zunongwangia profunda]MAC63928.1 hemolysin D [Flavobacteriaceae bacterium]MAS69482.1 hemolysin D [Zunongwangia sp.]ADF53200.1 hemolysin-3 family protein [Zunongwangia profunda SM-A87]HAJ82974.1 hemolysin D [Zunongwangia profunda]HCV82003.1 hemolysin D [Zunongwangia profunda]|tara:strand:+ start:2546 stop:3202 length:657 start_codon:yes stop_codon:yes gene_type:complete